MIDFYKANIETLSVHTVGNKSKGEDIFLSGRPCPLSDELLSLFKEFFFKPFREKEENYFRFTHNTDIEFNELYGICQEAFANPDSLYNHSLRIAQMLYEQSTTPQIRAGEIYVAYISSIGLDNKYVDAIGIFKSEIKYHFLQFKENQDILDLILNEGVNLNKLDKGCLIFNQNAEGGYKILSVDSNRYDTKYWINNFLNIEPLADDAFFTKRYLKMCQDFAKDVAFEKDKQEEILFMNRAVNHFAKNDEFEESRFLNEVMGDKVYKISDQTLEQYKDAGQDAPFEQKYDLISEFKNFKQQKGSAYDIEDVSSFPIVNKAVSEVRRKIKNVIDLDTNIQIKLNMVNPESAEKFVEKGWDQERGMYYYLIYFNKEQGS